MASPMTPERFQDRFEAFRGEPQQVSGVWTLHAAIAALPGSEAVLDEQAPWALTFSQRPAAPPAPAAPTGGLDPRGSEEAGMAGPQKAAPVQPGDTYLLVNDRDEDMEAYDHSGQLLWKIPCLARGQGAGRDLSASPPWPPHPFPRPARSAWSPSVWPPAAARRRGACSSMARGRSALLPTGCRRIRPCCWRTISS
jgi:hypothetical protein